jgi:short-subunit dehydrogenase
MKQLRNRVVVITGASSGFGRGVAEKFSKEGADLVLAARRGTLLDQVAHDCRKRGVRAVAVETDVSEREQVEALAETAMREFGRIDIWINNAGVATYGRFNDCPMEEHEQVIRTNLLGAMYGSRAALEHFRRQGHGTIINVASFAGIVSFPYAGSYVASKHGIRGLDVALRQELEANGEENIHVCTISPVSMDTPFFEHAGNHTGHPVRPIPPVYDPKLVVEAIYQVALQPRDEVVVARGKMGGAAKRLAPGLLERELAERAHKAMMEQSERAVDSSGNIFAPVQSGTDLRGGWRGRPLARRLVSTVLASAPAAAAWLVWNSARNRSLQQRQPAA